MFVVPMLARMVLSRPGRGGPLSGQRIVTSSPSARLGATMLSIPQAFRLVRSTVAQICRPESDSKIVRGSAVVMPPGNPMPELAARMKYYGSVGVPMTIVAEEEQKLFAPRERVRGGWGSGSEGLGSGFVGSSVGWAGS